LSYYACVEMCIRKCWGKTGKELTECMNKCISECMENSPQQINEDFVNRVAETLAKEARKLGIKPVDLLDKILYFDISEACWPFIPFIIEVGSEEFLDKVRKSFREFIVGFRKCVDRIKTRLREHENT